MAPSRPYERHAFVCTLGPWCRRDGPADEVLGVLRDGVKAAGLRDVVRVNRSGCLNQCGHGPMVVVYPEGRWYAGVDAAGAKRILEEDLLGGREASACAYRPERAGNNKLPERMAADRARRRQRSGE